MARIITQKFQTVRNGSSSVTATVVKLTSASDTVDVPNMQSTANCVVQLRRPGDPLVTISQSDINTVALTGNIGEEVLIVTLHDDPMPQPV